MHIQVSVTDADLVRIVTIYEPDSDEWIDHFTKR